MSPRASETAGTDTTEPVCEIALRCSWTPGRFPLRIPGTPAAGETLPGGGVLGTPSLCRVLCEGARQLLVDGKL